MFIACTKNHGILYLQVHETYTVVENGKSRRRSRVVKNIGPLHRYDDGQPDYLERLRQSFRDGCPLISTLEGLNTPAARERMVALRFDRESSDAVCDPRNIGYFLLDGLYDGVGIYDVLNAHKSRSKIEYDLNGLCKLLIFGRVLDPDSKAATWQERGRYLFEVASTDALIEVYRVLDALNDKAEAIQRRMNFKIQQTIGRDTDVCFYDVTNYWFEIDDPDEDELDEKGEVAKEGLRKPGPSKAKNRKPIVQMGLFMDSNGIPIGYRLFPGNHIDQTTLRPAMKKTLHNLSFGRVIVVADGGCNSGKNLAHIVSSGNGYIVARSPKGSDKTTKQWILDQDGYVSNEAGTFKVKSQIRERTVEDENGNRIKIREKIISYWSRAQYLHAMHENRKFLEYVNAAIAFPDKLKDKQSNLKKYLVTDQVDKQTGEVLDTQPLLSLDMDKIQADMALFGYYTIMTSEIEMDDQQIIDKYHGLSRIEDCFRTIKTDLHGRPVFLKTPEHINAHFLICFIALTMIRLIQHKILIHQGKSAKNTRNWELGLSPHKIKTALQLFQADSLPGGYFRLTKPTADMQLILDSFNINADLSLPNLSELYQLKYAFDKSIITHA